MCTGLKHEPCQLAGGEASRVRTVPKVEHAVRARPVRQQHALVEGVALLVPAQLVRGRAEREDDGVARDVAVERGRHRVQPAGQQLVKGEFAACAQVAPVGPGWLVLGKGLGPPSSIPAQALSGAGGAQWGLSEQPACLGR